MRRSYNHYDTYRGRTPLRTFLKGLAIALAVVLVLVVAGALWLTEQYRVYSADGVRLVLPWQEQAREPVSSVEVLPQVSPSAPLVVVTPEVAAPPFPPPFTPSASPGRPFPTAPPPALWRRPGPTPPFST